MYRGLKPIQPSKTVLNNKSIPIVKTATEKTGSPTIALKESPLDYSIPRTTCNEYPQWTNAIQNG